MPLKCRLQHEKGNSNVSSLEQPEGSLGIRRHDWSPDEDGAGGAGGGRGGAGDPGGGGAAGAPGKYWGGNGGS